MPVEFIGMISTRDQSETRRASGPVIDRDYLRRFARAHEDAGSTGPHRVRLVSAGRHPGSRLHRLPDGSPRVSHRPPARLRLSDASGPHVRDSRSVRGRSHRGPHHYRRQRREQRRDGDFLDKDSRYARTDEYLEILNRAWTSDGPFDYEGQYYQLKDFHADIRSAEQPRIPLYFGGSSEAAYRVGAKHADVFALWGEPLAETAEQIASVRRSAAVRWPFGRAGDQCVVPAHPRPDGGPGVGTGAADPGDDPKEHELFRESVAEAVIWPGWLQTPKRWVERLLAAAAKGELHDRALWTPLAAATGAAGNSTALVGTPETVAQALLDYVDIGVTTLLIRGYDPYDDAIDYGRHLLPLVREEVARRESGCQPRPYSHPGADPRRGNRDLRVVTAAGSGRGRPPEGRPSPVTPGTGVTPSSHRPSPRIDRPIVVNLPGWPTPGTSTTASATG